MTVNKKPDRSDLIFETGRVYSIGDTNKNLFVDNFGHKQVFVFHGDRSEPVKEMPEGERSLLCINYSIAGNDTLRISKFEDKSAMPKPFELFENSSTKVIEYFSTLNELLDHVKKNSEIIIKTDIRNKDYRAMHEQLEGQLNSMAPKEFSHSTYGVDVEKDVYIYYRNDTPVGMIGLKKITDQVYEMNSLFVNENFRNGGVAKKLINFIEVIAKGNKLVLEAWRNNKAAVLLYEKLGFTEVGLLTGLNLFGHEVNARCSDDEYSDETVFMEKNNK